MKKTYEKTIQIRKQKKLSQKELARLSGVSIKTINRYENGVKISFYCEKKILEVLDFDFLNAYDENSDKNKVSFDKQAEEYEESKYINQKNSVLQLINKGYPYTEKRVLDLGAGTGFVSREVANFAKEIYALDISDVMIKKMNILNQKNNLTNIIPIKGDAHNLNFEDNFFDTVITRLTLHHLKDVDLALNEIKRVLKNFGELIIVDVIASDDDEKADLQNSFDKIRDFSHNKFFKLNELKKKLKEIDFYNLEVNIWKEERNFRDWIKLAKYKDKDNVLFNIMKYFAVNGIKLGLDLEYKEPELSFKQKMVLIKSINIK
ncbi:methyltransferase domain-containing protein [Cetobacterium sp. 8H]|uniref:methyltransferase domain-containing protein n=1 Tax=Cetobacterium sp. 8H TaxID=2759681 RepID=UPI00163CAF1B|nr:methyltransferase domain-containing protein [Cetobacterium sp. 8H]MBC2852106.1 methyltransferase domain-containing protein [Cetobacterium sp. 8H]